MTSNDPYAVYESNLGYLRVKSPSLAKVLDTIDMDTIAFSTAEGKSFAIAIEGIQLTSRHDPEAEAALRCQHIGLNDKEVIVYGYECGYSVRHLLNTLHSLEALHIHILSSKAMKMALHLADHSEVINDSRVKFYYGEEYSGSKANYVFNPAEVNIADDVNWKKRDGLLYRCLSDYSNRQFMTSWGETLVRPGHTEELEKYDGVVDLYNTQKGEHAYVIGAGPTLERNVKRLKSILDINASSVVIVCDTAVSGLIKSGIRIDYVVTTDPEISKTYLDAALCPSTPLVFGVHTPIAYIESWQGPKYFYLSSVKVYDKYPKLVVKGRLFGGGSVIHPATDLAIKLGCESITFIGADFSFPYGKAHSFNDWGVRQVDQNWVLNSRKERVPTNANFAFYLVALEYLIAISPSAVFFNASKDGAKIAGADDDPTFGDL